MDLNHLLVVGGSSGIGRSFVLLAAAKYEAVTVLSRRGPRPDEEWPSNVCFEKADVLDAAATRIALADAVTSRGKLSGLVFFQRYRNQENSWEGNLASSLTATRNAIECLKDKFVERGDKAIVILASIASRAVADEQDEGYHAAKAGLLGLCRYYAHILGPLGIRVNCVSPGTLLKEASKHFYLENKQLHELYCKITPLRRMGTAEEVSSVVRFLLSPAASFVTGQELTVDGGAGLHWQESLARMLVPIEPVKP